MLALFKQDKNENIHSLIKIVKESEKRIDEFELKNRAIIGDPNINLNPAELYAPDFTVSGIKQKVFKTTGSETIIPLTKLTKQPINLISRRKYFRLAYIRIVWIPNATDLPGIVKIGILDQRAKVGKQTISFTENTANKMHRHTYYQDVFIHRSEYEKFAILVNLTGYEEKYESGVHLGSVRIYWILQLSNDPTQFEELKLDSELIPKPKMPSIQNLDPLIRRNNDIASLEFNNLSKEDSHSNKNKFLLERERVSFSQNDKGKEVMINDPKLFEAISNIVCSNLEGRRNISEGISLHQGASSENSTDLHKNNISTNPNETSSDNFNNTISDEEINRIRNQIRGIRIN